MTFIDRPWWKTNKGVFFFIHSMIFWCLSLWGPLLALSVRPEFEELLHYIEDIPTNMKNKKQKNKFRSISYSVAVSPFIHNIVFAHKNSTTWTEWWWNDGRLRPVSTVKWQNCTRIRKKKAKSAHLHFSVTILVNISWYSSTQKCKIIHFISFFFCAYQCDYVFFFCFTWKLIKELISCPSYIQRWTHTFFTL